MAKRANINEIAVEALVTKLWQLVHVDKVRSRTKITTRLSIQLTRWHWKNSIPNHLMSTMTMLIRYTMRQRRWSHVNHTLTRSLRMCGHSIVHCSFLWGSFCCLVLAVQHTISLKDVILTTALSAQLITKHTLFQLLDNYRLRLHKSPNTAGANVQCRIWIIGNSVDANHSRQCGEIRLGIRIHDI